jgi:hypothetical protein
MSGKENLKRHTEELEAYLRKQGLTPLSAPNYAFYNPPWTLPFLRRNEVLIEIAGPGNKSETGSGRQEQQPTSR